MFPRRNSGKWWKRALTKFNSWLPDETVAAFREYVVGIKGPLTNLGGRGSLNVRLRQLLDLYACVRPVRWFKGVPSPVKHPELVDMVIFRENTEDVYAGIEWREGTEESRKVLSFLNRDMGTELPDDSALGIKTMSAAASKRLIRKAIRYAIEKQKESVTFVHKGNIMKYTEGAFKEWGYQVAKEESPDYTITEDDLKKSGGALPARSKVVIKDRIADSMFQQLLIRQAVGQALSRRSGAGRTEAEGSWRTTKQGTQGMQEEHRLATVRAGDGVGLPNR